MFSKLEYESETAKTRDKRMKWWRDARFGMFIHYGLYSQLNANEWVMANENYEIEEYERLADSFGYIKGSAKKWAELAKKAGINIWCRPQDTMKGSEYEIPGESI